MNLRAAFLTELERSYDVDSEAGFRAMEAARDALDRALAAYAAGLSLAEIVVPERRPRVYYLRRTNGDIKIGYSKDVLARKGSIEVRQGPLDLLAWEAGGWDGGVVLPVHDEVIAMVPEQDAAEALAELTRCMSRELYGVQITAEASEPSFVWRDSA